MVNEAVAESSHSQPALSGEFLRKTLLILWRLAVVLTVLFFVYPVKFNMIRYCTVGGFFCIWAGAMILWWRVVPVRVLGVAVAIVAAAVAFLPGRPIDPMALRSADTKALTKYQGDRYLWGGESYLGIDCSGLIRRGAIDANLSVGYRTFNPLALREAFRMYWRDCSADDIGHGYGGRTRFIGDAKSIDSANPAMLQPGDMAVVAGGAHILAYLGNGEWIDADPKPMLVDRVRPPAVHNGWFTMPARIMRWKSMEG